MEFKLAVSHLWTILIVLLLAASVAFGVISGGAPDGVLLVGIPVLIGLHVVIWLRSKANFEKDGLRINFGLRQVKIPYKSMEKATSGRNVRIWVNNKRHPWQFKIRKKDKDAFLAELYRRRPVLKTTVKK